MLKVGYLDSKIAVMSAFAELDILEVCDGILCMPEAFGNLIFLPGN